MYDYNKKDVRNNFSHARYLMQVVNQMITGDELEDYTEGGEFGQIVNELVASVSTVLAYRMERSPSGY